MERHIPGSVHSAISDLSDRTYNYTLELLMERIGVADPWGDPFVAEMLHEVENEVVNSVTDEEEEQIIEKVGAYVIHPFYGHQVEISSYIIEEVSASVWQAIGAHGEISGIPLVMKLSLTDTTCTINSFTPYYG